MRSSYRKEDVRFLLTDITGKVTPQPADERERQIQAGIIRKCFRSSMCRDYGIWKHMKKR